MTITGSHDTFLVTLSILVATVASYGGLRHGRRYRVDAFVAMLAFSMPDMAMSHDIGLTALSFALPIVVTGIGFHVVNRLDTGPKALALSGLVMGIAGMPYTGMAACGCRPISLGRPVSRHLRPDSCESASKVDP